MQQQQQRVRYDDSKSLWEYISRVAKVLLQQHCKNSRLLLLLLLADSEHRKIFIAKQTELLIYLELIKQPHSFIKMLCVSRERNIIIFPRIH
jgi:predicted component of type VI protein secretion system